MRHCSQNSRNAHWVPSVRHALLGLVLLTCFADAHATVPDAGTWVPVSGATGAVSAVVISPSEPDRIYIGTADGVYRSVDGGTTWTRASAGLAFTLVNCLGLAASPTEVLYAGTAGGGVFRSDDLGESWRPANLGAEGRILSVQVDHSNAADAYAIARDVVRTQQGGSYWYSAASGLGSSVSSLALAPSDTTILYAVADFLDRDSGTVTASVFRSVDSGATWSLDSGQQSLVLPRFEESVLEVDPTDSRVVYLGSQGGLFKRSPEGVWERVVLSSGPVPQVRAVAVAKGQPNTVLVAADGGFFRSLDGGRSFSRFSPPGGELNRVHSLKVCASPEEVFAGTRFGLFRSQDGGASWESLRSGLPPASALGFEFDPLSPLTVYLNTNLGFIKSTRGGLDGGRPNASLADFRRRRRVEYEISKVWTDADSGQAEIFVDPSNPRRLLVAANGLQLSEDGGVSFSRRLNEQVNGLAFSQSSPGVVYAATTGTGLLKSVDGGVHWTASAEGLPFDDFGGPGSPRTVFEVGVDPFDPSIIYVGGRFGVHKSVDGGASWSLPICCPFLAGAIRPLLFSDEAQVVSLAFDPIHQGTIYAGLNPSSEYPARVYKTEDGGATWQPSFSGIPPQTRVLVAVDPANTSTVFAGTWGYGVYRSVDGGSHWEAFNDGLENLFVKSLRFDFRGRLHVGTEGGLFQLQPSQPVQAAPVHLVQTLEGTLIPSGQIVLKIDLLPSPPSPSTPLQARFAETLPEGLTLIEAEADRGNLALGPSLNTVTWTGTLGEQMPAKIRLKARIDENETAGERLFVQGVAWLNNGGFALTGGPQAPGEPTNVEIGVPPFGGRSLFVPATIPVPNSYVGVATANLGTVSASARIQTYTANGGLIAELDAGGLSSLEQTTFIAGVAAEGGDSVLVNGSPATLDGFFLIGDESLDRLDGIGGRLTDGQILVLPFARASGSGRLILSFFNPDSGSSSNAVLSLLNHQGEPVAEASFEVGPLGSVTTSSADLFGGEIVGDGYLRLESDRPMRGFELDVDSHSFTAASAVSPIWTNRLRSPHFFFDGSGGATRIRVVNTSTTPARLTFRVIDDGLGLIAEREVELGSQGLGDYDLRALADLPPEASRQGHVEIEASGADFEGVPLPASLLAVAIYTSGNGELRSNLPLTPRGGQDTAFLQVAQSEEVGFFQGLAVVAPEGADLELSAYDKSGQVTAQRAISLPPGGRVAGLLDELFGAGFQQVGGILRVKANRDVFAFSLFGGARFLAAVEGSQVPVQ